VGPSLIGARVFPDDLPEIGDGRPRADLLEHVIGPRRLDELGHGAGVVLQVAERNRLRRACLLTRRADVAVAHRALLVARSILAGDDALEAHRTLLHHAELTDRDVGVQLHLERRRELVLEPVEAAHVVGAVVAAVACPDATVVDLSIEPLVGPIRRVHGADRLAGRNLAVLAEHRQEQVRGTLRVAVHPALEAEPVQLPPVRCGGLPDHRHVVLGLASDHARLAAHARVDVDRHAPARARVLLVGVHADRRRVRRLAP